MWINYLLWKRRVKKIAPEKCSLCCVCEEAIYPDDFVGETTDGRLFHAGYHFSLKRGKDAFCETGAAGIGIWNGKEVQRIPSLMSKVMESGKPMIRTVGPEGVVDQPFGNA
jgi:hypothetical protein